MQKQVPNTAVIFVNLFSEQIVCGSFTVGWYGQNGSNNGRRVKVMCYYLDGTVNLYMRPIEGVTVTVDLDSMKIVGFLDRIKVPVPKGDGTDYRGSQQKPPFGPCLNDINVVQPDGPSFTLDGHLVRYMESPSPIGTKSLLEGPMFGRGCDTITLRFLIEIIRF